MKVFLTLAITLLTLTVSAEAQAAGCTVAMKNPRGMVMQTFQGQGYDRQMACQRATNKCQRAAYQSRHPRRVRCEVMRRGGHDQRLVTRQCSVDLRGPRGHRTFQTFFAQATGRRGTGVKQEACMKAQRKCNRFRMSNGRYRAQCVRSNL